MPGVRPIHRLKPPSAAALRLLAHPLRFDVLGRLAVAVRSPSELARDMDVDLKVMSYHVRQLVDVDAVELVEVRSVRGAREHRYRAVMRPQLTDQDYERVSPKQRRALTSVTLKRVLRDADQALDAGGWDHAETHVSWQPLDLDPERAAEVQQILADTVARLTELHAEAAEHAAPETLERTVVSLLHYAPGPRER